MSQTVNRTAPTLGNAVAYFVILYLVLEGHIPEKYHVEAVAMAGAVLGNVIMDTKAFFRWVGGLIEGKVNNNVSNTSSNNDGN